MKKFIVAIVVIGSALCFTGCAKSCNCKTGVEGDVTFSKEWTVDLDEGESCSDFESKAGGLETKCTPVYL